MAGKDQRRAPRDKHDSVIEIFNVEGKVAATGRLKDFSPVGASFTVGEPVVMPGKFRARLRFLDKGVIEIEAHVVRTVREKNRTHYGIKFDSYKTVYPTGELKEPWK